MIRALWLALALILGAGAAKAADSISTDKPLYFPGQTITGTWVNLNGSSLAFDWVCLVNTNSGCTSGPTGAQGGLWQAVTARSNASTFVQPTKGRYQLVYYATSASNRASGNTEILRSPEFVVDEPASCQPALGKWSPTMHVFSEGSGPPNGLRDECYEFPIDYYATSNSFTSGTKAQQWFFGWGNRCNIGGAGGALCDATNLGNFPNITIAGTTYRFNFTTVAKANACTIAQTQQLLGQEAAAQGTLITAGVTILEFQDPAGVVSGGAITDVCWLFMPPTLTGAPAGALPRPTNFAGLAVDYEPHDYRATADTNTVWTTLAGLLHAAGKTLVLYTNPLPNTADAITSANGNYLLGLSDLVSIVGDNNAGTVSTFAGERSYLDSQIAVYAPSGPSDYAKIFVSADMGANTLALNQAIHQAIVSEGLWGVDLFADGASVSVPNGSYWKIMRCLVYGLECS